MGYQLNLGDWNAIFAVPSVLVDRHLKLAGKEQLQVILWILRHTGEPFTPETLSSALGISIDSALDALDYWTDCGLLAANGEQLHPPVSKLQEADVTKAAAPSVPAAPLKREPAAVEPAIPENLAKETVKTPTLQKPKRLVKPDGLYLATRMKESDEIRFLMQEAEITLGKTISPALSSTLLSLCDDYGLPVEVIVMILHYAKDVGKTGTAYIESVARDWAQSNIFTLEAAEEKLQELSERRLAWGRVESAAGLSRRSPSKKEEDAAFRWVKEWKFSQEMLSGAYERCVDNLGKFHIGYMNKILERWHKTGFTSMAQVTADEQFRKNEEENKKSYDIDELERMSFFDPPEDL